MAKLMEQNEIMETKAEIEDGRYILHMEGFTHSPQR